MKKISLLLILNLTAILLLFIACDKTCVMKPPKDLKPIDWENYNSVYNVFYNYYALCNKQKYEDEKKNIMIYGWIYPQWEGWFILRDSPNNANENLAYPWIRILSFEVETEFQAKLDTCDLTKKCFIKGKLIFNCLHSGMCSTSVPEIIISNLDDVYFE